MASSSDAAVGTASIAPEFMIGVTGHRDIPEADADGLRGALRAALGDVAQHFDHARLRLACGLADGADTLAAEVALDMGIAVLAVLPMPQALYETDFDGAALDRLRALTAHPNVQVVHIPLAENASTADIETQAARDVQYQLLADYLTRRSNVLLAVWDGVDIGLPGGTSDVVLRYLADGRDQTPNPVAPVETTDEGCGNLLIWVPTRRQSAADATPPAGTRYLVSNANYDCYWHAPSIPEPFSTRWHGFDTFAEERTSDLGRDLPAYGLAQEGDAVRRSDPAALDQEYIRADQLARAYQIQSDRMFALFGLMAAAMGLTFLIYAKLLADKAFLYIYVGLFVAGFLGFRYCARRHLHSKHLAYRALAETFRVQYFLILSGAGEAYSLRRILGLTSVDQFARLEWLQEAVRCSEPLVYFGHCAKGDVLAVVRERWIEDQSGYFDKKLHRLHTQHARLETIKKALLLGSLVGALALIFFKKSLIHLDMAGSDGKSWLVFFMGLLPLWAAIWELYQGKMATRELLWQYANQRRYFRAAAREIIQAPGLAEGQKIIRDLADKALIEIYLWSVHRFHREHEPPAAG